MSCCGGKRAQLARQSAPAPREDPQLPGEPAVPEHQARTFEYIGKGTLTLRGAVSGKPYRFTFPGARIEVAHDDSFAMMAERDVRPASRARE